MAKILLISKIKEKAIVTIVQNHIPTCDIVKCIYGPQYMSVVVVPTYIYSHK